MEVQETRRLYLPYRFSNQLVARHFAVVHCELEAQAAPCFIRAVAKPVGNIHLLVSGVVTRCQCQPLLLLMYGKGIQKVWHLTLLCTYIRVLFIPHRVIAAMGDCCRALSNRLPLRRRFRLDCAHTQQGHLHQQCGTLGS